MYMCTLNIHHHFKLMITEAAVQHTISDMSSVAMQSEELSLMYLFGKGLPSLVTTTEVYMYMCTLNIHHHFKLMITEGSHKDTFVEIPLFVALIIVILLVKIMKLLCCT